MPRLSPLEQLALDRHRAALSTTSGPWLRAFVRSGSRARSDGHEESDLDVLVMMGPLDDAARRIAIDVAADLSVAAGLVQGARVDVDQLEHERLRKCVRADVARSPLSTL